MIKYWSIDEFVSRKADLYNYINPFFNLNYLKSHNFFYIVIGLKIYRNYFDNVYNNVDKNIRLDVNQRIAILTNSKNELIIAGAGSGKTTTIAAKIKFMVEILKIEASSILLLSYTNEAVKEMKNIIVDKFKIGVNILTFHKFAIMLLDGIENIYSLVPHKEVLKDYNIKEKAFLYSFLYIFYNLTILDFKNDGGNFEAAFELFQKDCNKYKYENLRLKKYFKSFWFKKNAEIYFKHVPSGYMTFDSIIYEAYMLPKYNYYFKYILIDEYQDISNLRLKFIKKYVKLSNSSLMCVGDDWQTIFSFASSNINNILNFENDFYDAQTLKIVKTYRNSQELINIAGNFIMKNDAQIKKKLRSPKHIEKPIEFIKYRNKSDEIDKISHIIDKIIDKKIAFLTRYTFDIKDIIDNNIFRIDANKLIYKNIKEIKFYTIHASKGLGFDYVFILNHKKNFFGFPSTRKEVSFFKEENVIYEERRLYYVALTRTKNKVYLVYPNKKQSVFLKEMKKMLKKK